MSSTPPDEQKPGGKNSPRPAPEIADHELVSPIGNGSYGQVWLARNSVGTLRAVKVVYNEGTEDARAAEREFSGLCRYEPLSRRHEGLVDILHVGRNQEAGYFYYVMELADNLALAPHPELKTGSSIASSASTLLSPVQASASPYLPHTLAQELKRRGRLPVSECIDLGLALLAGVAALHRHELLHRDIKPSNIIFVDGVPKLADIGLVAIAAEADSIVGTYGYVPPEGHGAPKGDLYSIGKVLYECVTGKDRKQYPQLPAELADFPDRWEIQEFNEVLLRACEDDARQRYASAAAMQSDLLHLRQGESLRQLRRRNVLWRRAKRMSAAGALLAALLVAGYLYQHVQTRRYQQVAAEARAALIQLHTAEGVRAMEEGDHALSLLWLTQALRLVEGDAESERIHRRRIEAVRRRCPEIIALGEHGGPVSSIEFSRDGRWLVSASEDRTAQVWSASTGERVGPALLHAAPVNEAYFSPDSKLIVTACDDGAAHLWDGPSGREIVPPLRHAKKVNFVGFSPDGRSVATASDDGTARVWEVATGRPLTPWLQHRGPVNDVEFSPDGRRIVTASDDDTARVWDASVGEPLTGPLQHGDDVATARFSPDGNWVVTASHDRTARLWSADTGQPKFAAWRHAARLRTARFSPDGSKVVAAGGGEGYPSEARIWDVQTGESSTPSLVHSMPVRAAAFSPDGKWLVTTCHDSIARLWDVATGRYVGSPLRHQGPVWSAAFSSDGLRLVTCGKNNAWREWDLTAVLSSDPAVTAAISCPLSQASRDGHRWLILTNNQAAFWSGDSGTAVRPFFDPGNNLLFWATFSPQQDRAATVSGVGVIRLWDVATGMPVDHALTNALHVGAVTYSHAGRYLATVGGREDRTGGLWDLGQPTPRWLPLKETLCIEFVLFSHDDRWLVTCEGSPFGGGKSGQAQVWSTADGRPVGPPLAHNREVHCAAFSPDDRYLATASTDELIGPQSVRIWDLSTGRYVGIPSAELATTAVAYDATGRLLATGSGSGTVRVWEVETGKAIDKPIFHGGTIVSLRFSRNGRLLLVCSKTDARLWEVRTGEPCGLPVHYPGLAISASFGPDETSILIAGQGAAIVARADPSFFSTAMLQAMAECGTGHRLDQGGGLVPLAPNEILADLKQIRAAKKR